MGHVSSLPFVPSPSRRLTVPVRPRRAAVKRRMDQAMLGSFDALAGARRIDQA